MTLLSMLCFAADRSLTEKLATCTAHDSAAWLVQSGGLVVAEILELAPHPSADRLRVCTVDVGAADPVTVVTNAADAAGGRRVFVAVSERFQPDDQWVPIVFMSGRLPFEIALNCRCWIACRCRAARLPAPASRWR